jgi:uncharacterized protein YbjT (DUF2867 family)/alpha-beta hydrolase superfamily lysophospholipase
MAANPQRILVAGASGYLGGFVAQEFKRRGHFVRGLARSTLKLERLRDSLDEMVQGEVTQPESLAGTCEGIDVVFSSIGITKQAGKLTFKDVDYQGNLNLLQAAIAAGVKRFVYVSVFDGPSLLHLEIVKAHEDFVAELRSSGLSYAVLRPTGYFSDMGEFFDMANTGRVFLFGAGANKINPIHGADLAVACCDQLEGQDVELDVGGPDTLSYREIATLALEALGKPVKITSLPTWLGWLLVSAVRVFNRHKGGLLAFVVTMATRDVVAPSTGTRSLADHYQELAAAEPAQGSLPGGPRRAARWIRSHPGRALLALVATLFLVLNYLAYQHAGAMTTFASEGASTARPEDLSLAQRASTLMFGVRVRRPTNPRTPAEVGLPFSTHEFYAEGTKLEVWLVAREQSLGTVVLCHGYAGSKSYLLPVSQELYDLGYSSVLLDFRGSGGSEGNTTSLGYHEALDVAAAMLFARERTPPDRPLVLFGTSMGAAAALRAVHSEGVEPSALILEAPFNRLLDTVRNRFHLMGLPGSPGAELLVFWGGVRGRMQGFSHNPAEYAASVRCPTLILHGDEDQRVSLAQVREVLAGIPQGLGSLEILKGVGHEFYAVVRRDEWLAALKAFLASKLNSPKAD